jgi:hypothetical protein
LLAGWARRRRRVGGIRHAHEAKNPVENLALTGAEGDTRHVPEFQRREFGDTLECPPLGSVSSSGFGFPLWVWCPLLGLKSLGYFLRAEAFRYVWKSLPGGATSNLMLTLFGPVLSYVRR